MGFFGRYDLVKGVGKKRVNYVWLMGWFLIIVKRIGKYN